MNTEMTDTAPCRRDRQIAVWLFICCLMVYAMVILGGVTRLTGSGLSMVEWDPIFGIVPPLDHASWRHTFQLYQKSPEFQQINTAMDLAGFKKIYWFEYTHRVLGRTIGSVFLLPFLFFLYKGWLRRPLTAKLLVMFVLGGLQGLLGWYMVKSGLVDNPHVSQYRLTAHLGLAILIYVFMLYVALGLWLGKQRTAITPAGIRRATTLLIVLIFITILSGGFVAGLQAGLAYNTFPLMDGHWVPQVIFMQSPLWRNFFENIATVQFNHRLLATLVFSSVVLLWLAARRQPLANSVSIGLQLMLAAAVIQVSLGISTLLLHVPVALAATHQAGALLLLTVTLYTRRRMSPGEPAF